MKKPNKTLKMTTIDNPLPLTVNILQLSLLQLILTHISSINTLIKPINRSV